MRHISTIAAALILAGAHLISCSPAADQADDRSNSSGHQSSDDSIKGTITTVEVVGGTSDDETLSEAEKQQVANELNRSLSDDSLALSEQQTTNFRSSLNSALKSYGKRDIAVGMMAARDTGECFYSFIFELKNKKWTLIDQYIYDDDNQCIDPSTPTGFGVAAGLTHIKGKLDYIYGGAIFFKSLACLGLKSSTEAFGVCLPIPKFLQKPTTEAP